MASLDLSCTGTSGSAGKGFNFSALNWEHGVLAVVPPGKSLDSDFVRPKPYIIWGLIKENSTNITNKNGTEMNIYLDSKMKSQHTRTNEASKCQHHKIQKIEHLC